MSEMILKLPNSYVDIDREEMEYIDGGAFGIDDAILLILAVGGASYGGGYAVGQAYYYHYGSKNYNRDKYFIYSAAASLFGIMGGVFDLGFYNGYNSVSRH